MDIEEKNEGIAPKFRRRIIIIKRALQLKYVALIFVSAFFTLTIVFLDVYYFISKALNQAVTQSDIGPFIENSIFFLEVHLSLFFLVVILISVFVSHKFAGPIFRLERVAEDVTKGDLTIRAHLRKGDEFHDTAELMNQMIGTIQEKVKADVENSQNVAKELNDISAKLKEGKLSSPEASQKLSEYAERLRQIGSYFKV